MATIKNTSFELKGADGGPLRGTVRTVGDGKGRPAVVVCHGFKGFKDWGFFPHLAHRLANAGLTTVTFNFSGSGIGPDGESFSEPERFARATHTRDLEDIDIVTKTLRGGGLGPVGAPPSKIGLFGHSRGGGSVVLAAGHHGQISALVTWAAISRVDRWPEATVAEWRRTGTIDIVNARTGDVLPIHCDLLDDIEAHSSGSLNISAAAGHVTAPWLIVHGENDEAVPVADARRLRESASNSAEAQLVLIEEGTHTLGARHPWAGNTEALRKGLDSTVAWFTRHML